MVMFFMIFNRAVKPIVDNQMAMLQLEDSQSAYVFFRLYNELQTYIPIILIGAVIILLFPELKNGFTKLYNKIKSNQDTYDIN